MIESIAHQLINMPLAKQGGSQYSFLIMMVLMIGVFWFMLIRPQKQQQKKRQDMLDALNKGEKIITTGGIYGTIIDVGEHSLRVRVAEGVVLRMSRKSIAGKTQKEDGDSK